MVSINPYVGFNGNAEEAFNFYKSIFGGEFTAVMRYKDMPAEYCEPNTDVNQIMHISLPIGSNVLMGSDSNQQSGKSEPGSNFSISVTASSEEEADRFFNGLNEGGSITMPIGKVFWGSYFGMLKDKFGIHWMVSYDYNQP